MALSDTNHSDKPAVTCSARQSLPSVFTADWQSNNVREKSSFADEVSNIHYETPLRAQGFKNKDLHNANLRRAAILLWESLIQPRHAPQNNR